MTRRSVTRRGLQLSYLDSAPGDPGRRAVLLLHGFPDEASMWEPVAERLHEAGVRVIAPDTVGCGESDMGARVGDYDIDAILDDLCAVLDDAGVEAADAAGHDWGAALAWCLAMRRPERVRTVTAASVGHLASFVRGGLRQKLMSWYIAYFHLAGLAERRLPKGGPLGLRRVFRGHPDMDPVLERLAAPGRLTAALRIYRANVVRQVLLRRHPPVRQPVLVLHSAGDHLLAERQSRGSGAYATGPFTFVRLAGGHWIPLEHPDRFAALLLRHIGAAEP